MASPSLIVILCGLTSAIFAVCSEAARVAERATERTERRGVEWTCDNCTYINRDTDIECRICAHAPWKQKLIGLRVPVSKNQTAGELPGQSEDQSKSQWKCSICTVVNDAASMQCGTCETPWIADRRRDSSNTSASDRPTTPRTHLATQFSFQPAENNRAPSPGKIMGTVSQSTQTESVEAAGNPAQKVIGRICQLVKRSGGIRTPVSSREGSPRTGTPEPKWSPVDNAMARWTCSRCQFENNMDKMDCERCRFEDTTPAVKFSTCSNESLKFVFGDRSKLE